VKNYEVSDFDEDAAAPDLPQQFGLRRSNGLSASRRLSSSFQRRLRIANLRLATRLAMAKFFWKLGKAEISHFADTSSFRNKGQSCGGCFDALAKRCDVLVAARVETA
jgi:hypothetical protein